MKKSVCAILSLVLLFVLIPGAAVADEDNLLVNPTFELVGGEVEGWTKSGAGGDSLLWSELVTQDATAPTTGNVLASTTNIIYISTADFLPLNADKQCYITVWYQSSVLYDARVYVNEYDADGSSTGNEAKYEFPSSGGAWKRYKIPYAAKYTNTTQVKIMLRFQSPTGGAATTGGVAFAAPTYGLELPTDYLTNANFDDGADDWAVVSAADVGTYEGAQEANGNRYMKITGTATANMRIQNTTAETNLLTNGTTYRISFKFMPLSAGATPRVDLYSMTTIGYQVEEAKNFDLLATVLGTPTANQWTQYVWYYTLTGERADKDGPATRLRICLYGKLGETAAYDDISITPAVDNMLLYQNGAETKTLAAGEAAIMFHHINTTEVSLITALYEVKGNVKVLHTVYVDAVNAVGDTVKTFTIPAATADTKYQLSGYVWDSTQNITPTMKKVSAIQ